MNNPKINSHQFVSKYDLQHIMEENDKVKYVGFDKDQCGCTLRSTHGLPCSYELASFGVGSIPLQSVHVLWTQLRFLEFQVMIVHQSCQSKRSLMSSLSVLKRLKILVRLTLRISCTKLHIYIRHLCAHHIRRLNKRC